MKKYLIAAVFGISLFGGLVYRASVFRPLRNFHVVDPGKLYRSAQPTPEDLAEFKRDYGIRTVINLRGKKADEWWYQDEEKAAQELGLKLINIPFSSRTVQDPEEWMRYLKTLKTAERPMLIHCRSGADRTGEAAAIYAIEYMKQTIPQALDQLSLKYLHVDYFRPSKRLFVENYRGEDWVLHGYNICDDNFRPYADVRCRSVPATKPATKPEIKAPGEESPSKDLGGFYQPAAFKHTVFAWIPIKAIVSHED